MLEAWPWTHPGYAFYLDWPIDRIARIEIDASLRLADVDRTNNTYEPADGEENPGPEPTTD